MRGHRRAPPLGNKSIHGEMIWDKCSCGKWIEIKTGKHVDGVVQLSLKEFMERFKRTCPTEAEKIMKEDGV